MLVMITVNLIIYYYTFLLEKYYDNIVSKFLKDYKSYTPYKYNHKIFY